MQKSRKKRKKRRMWILQPEMKATEAVGEEESKYSLMYDFMDGHTGNGTMLPNSQMTISTSVYHSDEDGDETISEAYKLELKPMDR